MNNKPTTAPMGWNSWDCYGAGVTEDTVKANAQYMAENLKKYGWDTVVVDIEWYAPEAKTHEYEPFAELCMDDFTLSLLCNESILNMPETRIRYGEQK